MKRPLVIAHHLIWTVYGSWLPNDPRGSGSRTIKNFRYDDLGEVHYGRRQIQPARSVVREFYEQAEMKLLHPLLQFDETEFSTVADVFESIIEERRYTCYACAIMPDHVHLLIRKHRDKAEEMIEAFQTDSVAPIVTAGLRADDHPIWTNGGWKVFLESPEEIRRTIAYIERNPLKAGLPAQSWAFVTPYDGWPLHPGHSPNSPYAKRLRRRGAGG